MCCVCTGGIQASPKHTTGYSNIWGASNIWRVSKHEGNPYIQGASKCMGAYGHSFSVTKNAFFCVVYVWGASKHYPNIQGVSNIQTCGHPNIQGVHPEIWGHPNIQGVHQNIWGIQTYRVHPNVWGHMDTPLV